MFRKSIARAELEKTKKADDTAADSAYVSKRKTSGGKTMTLVTPLEFEDAEVNDTDRPRPKVGRIPVKLRLNNEDAARETYVDTSLNSRKGDTQFMMLLVALFIIVNLSLITLLNQKSKTAAAQQPAVAAATAPVVPAASVAAPVQPTAIPVIAPTAVTAPVVQQNPAAAPLAPLPLQAAPASAPIFATPQTPTGYITPVTPDTVKATAAPFHKVTVTEHAPVTAPASVDTRLTVIHAAQEAPAAEAAKLAPAAGAPAATAQPAPVAAPAVTATQDLLSVINKD